MYDPGYQSTHHTRRRNMARKVLKQKKIDRGEMRLVRYTYKTAKGDKKNVYHIVLDACDETTDIIMLSFGDSYLRTSTAYDAMSGAESLF